MCASFQKGLAAECSPAASASAAPKGKKGNTGKKETHQKEKVRVHRHRWVKPTARVYIVHAGITIATFIKRPHLVFRAMAAEPNTR